jgi:hypothetical protein
MPVDERWDHLSDEEWAAFAQAWVEQLRSGRREGERDWGETVTMMNFTARPQQQWKFILAAAAVAESDDELRAHCCRALGAPPRSAWPRVYC